MEKDRESSGQISIDFLIGISLFLLTLVFLVQFIPTVFVSFGSESIDLSSVAYRTSVILVEDPGCWNNSATLRTESDWENHVDRTTRVGLAIDKDHPNILNLSKIEAFSNTTALNDSMLINCTTLYRIIGGNRITYNFNITIAYLNGTVIVARGDKLPQSGDAARIERLVLVKQNYPFRGYDADTLSGNTTRSSALFNVTSTYALNNTLYFNLTNFNITGTDPRYNATYIGNSTSGNSVSGNWTHLDHPDNGTANLTSYTDCANSTDCFTQFTTSSVPINTTVNITDRTDELLVTINNTSWSELFVNTSIDSEVYVEIEFINISIASSGNNPYPGSYTSSYYRLIPARVVVEVW
ncbi:MAG: hypothetical protein OCU18_04320 [Candidatus Syntrophoarchaeum sp.]|nr:hypothetical protein [Candidatus Syntrophoarchaeum sp.]